MDQIAKRRCKWRARRIAWCRKYGRFCDAPREYETCPGYEPIGHHSESTTFKRVRRNLDLLRHQFLPSATKESPQLPSEQQIMEATKRFMRYFFRARGFLPENPIPSLIEIHSAIKELEIIKHVLAPQDYEYMKAVLSEIKDDLTKNKIAPAISKMERLWAFMLTKAFPPPPYIASPFPVEMKGSERTYKFCLRFLDGIHCYTSEGKDVSAASDKLEKCLPIKGAEFSAIIDSVEIWNPKEKRWEPHRPWWEEEKEPYEWERSGVQIPVKMDVLNMYDKHPSYTSMYNSAMSSTLELKERFGSELRNMIAEAESQKREVGAMLCRTATGQPHLSRACFGKRETVTVSDCHDGLSPLGSFHVHLSGTDVFSVPDLELAIRKEQLSCLGYTKGAHPYLKCINPRLYLQLPYQAQIEIKRSLDQARQDIEKATELFRASPSNPEARLLSRRAQAALRNVESLLEAYEVPL